uniref:Iron-binding protein iscA n=1 Tax=Candidatus Endecteinascidia fromenterensis TaxID=266021 RepID=G8D475_9GAMM|nr:iron-binding protein iscA [Candidatus Endoecteinascidia frumentensis]
MVKISISSKAQKYIKKWINHSAKSLILRLGTKKSGCSGFSYFTELVELPKKNDVQIDSGQILFPVIMDKNSIHLLSNLSIDLVENNIEKKLVYLNPNATAKCGCGESFTVIKI